MPRDRILVAEEEAAVREVMRQHFHVQGQDVLESDSCAGAEELWRTAQPDIAILDSNLPDGSVLELLPRLKAMGPSVPIMVLTGSGAMDVTAGAIKLGADQVLTKPVEPAALAVIVRRALENYRRRQKQLADDSRSQHNSTDPFAGTSAAVQRLAEVADHARGTDRPVLIQGEPGSGKGTLARWLHDNGPNVSGPFVELNCCGLSADVLEAELFGRPSGEGPHALEATPGLLEIAHKGTLFLDEIGEMDPRTQPKLLRVLEERKYHRPVDGRESPVQVRLITATRHDLSRLVWEKRFRGDLYFRINATSLTTLPLRERAEDIPVIAAHMLARLSIELGVRAVRLSTEAVKALQMYSWPGNIRELRNVLERAVLLGGGGLLTEKDLCFHLSRELEATSLRDVKTLEQVERQHIEEVLLMERGRVEPAAKKLGIPRSSLYNKIKQYGIARQSAGATLH